MRSAVLSLALFGGVLLPLDSAGAVRPATEASAGRPEPDLATAKQARHTAGGQAYVDNCARCHGPTGAGDGRDADAMFPRPRALSEGVFKFRTTASGTPPTDEDLFRTITDGLPGSRMPEFQRLPEETRWQLVEYVKNLSPAFEGSAPEPIDLGSDPGSARADLARGRQLYAQLGCSACHGNQGRGNGPSAPTLVDQWGEPTQAADLTQGWNYRGGSSARDILTRLMTGLDGTPMPSYAEAVSAEEVWDLAYHVHSLQVQPRWAKAVEAARIAGDLPEDPGDGRWQAAPRSDLRLSSLFYRDGKVLPTQVNAISVQALYNEKEIAFRLSWHDRTESREFPPDAVAVVLLADLRMKWRIGSLRSLPAAPSIPNLDICRWSAEDGFGPGDAAYEDGEWTVLVRRPAPARPMRSRVAGGGPVAGRPLVWLEPATEVPFGVMVWDGGNREEGRHRANSRWVSLILKEKE